MPKGYDLGTLFQSTHPAWDVTPGKSGPVSLLRISIHTSRMGCDGALCQKWPRTKFQSTHPAWDVTHASVHDEGGSPFQSTHPAWDVTAISILLISY